MNLADIMIVNRVGASASTGAVFQAGSGACPADRLEHVDVGQLIAQLRIQRLGTDVMTEDMRRDAGQAQGGNIIRRVDRNGFGYD